MKITHNKVGTQLNTSDSAKATGADKASASEKVKNQNESLGKANSAAAGALDSTKVDLSPRAQEMKKIKDAALAAPDVDEAKVARLQKMIDEGSYKVSAKDIADRMVDEELKWM